MLLGDRFEILAAGPGGDDAAFPSRTSRGGDVTEGAVDEAIRHAITKLAHLHFATNDGRRPIAAMGEPPAGIHVVGNPGLDAPPVAVLAATRFGGSARRRSVRGTCWSPSTP